MTTQAETRLLKKIAQFFEEINFEFTSPGTPQKNGEIKWVFVTYISWMRTMMDHAGLYKNIKNGICSKCAATTKLENIMVNPHEEKCGHEKFYVRMPD